MVSNWYIKGKMNCAFLVNVFLILVPYCSSSSLTTKQKKLRKCAEPQIHQRISEHALDNHTAIVRTSSGETTNETEDAVAMVLNYCT